MDSKEFKNREKNELMMAIRLVFGIGGVMHFRLDELAELKQPVDVGKTNRAKDSDIDFVVQDVMENDLYNRAASFSQRDLYGTSNPFE